MPAPQESAEPNTPSVNRVFDGESALNFAATQVLFGPRPTGSGASRSTASYIESTLSGVGWRVERQPFRYMNTDAVNIIGKSGAGKHIYLLGAHYDTRRRADRDLSNPALPVIGANDGASGVAVLLELARVLDTSRIDGEVWLVFFDAEDNGQLDGWDWIIGSQTFAQSLTRLPDYAIIVDMVGDANQNIYFDANSDQLLRDRLWRIARDAGNGEYFIPEVRYSMLDDHTPFVQRGIPGVDIIDFDYPYWHTTKDTLDKLSAVSLERVGRTLEIFLEAGGDYPLRN